MVALNLTSLGRTSGKKIISFEDPSPPGLPHKPTHFPQTPYLQSKLDDNSSIKRDPFARNDVLQHSSIYNTFTTNSPTLNNNTKNEQRDINYTGGGHRHKRNESDFSLDRQVVDIVADYVKPESDKELSSSHTTTRKPQYREHKNSDFLSASAPLSPVLSERPTPSRASSFNDQSSAPPSPLIAPSILSQGSTSTNLHQSKPTNMRGSNIRRGGSKTSTKTSVPHGPGMLEKMEELDELKGLRNDSMPHILSSFDRTFNQSVTSVGSRTKADKMLGIDSNAKLASLYLVSGLAKSTAQWSFADSDSSRGVQPLEDSMGLFWRPEMLGSSFSGEKTEESSRARKDSKSSTFTNGLSKDIRGKYVPDAGPDGAQRLVSKSIKFAHPRDVEVVNSTLSPPTTCHAFTFTIPRHDTLAAIARTRLDSAVSGAPNTLSMLSAIDEQGNLDPSLHLQARGNPNVRNSNSASATELTFHGVTLTVWTHADRDRAVQLKTIKMRAERAKLGQGSLNSVNPLAQQQRKGSTAPSEGKKGGTKRGSLQYMMGRNQSEGDITGTSETETGMSDSDLEGPLGRRAMIRNTMNSDRLSTVDSVPEDVAAAYDEASDIFWMPYAITLVSRFPIYDFLQDYLRLSWARFSKNAKIHMTQINRLLNYDPPRPGEAFKLPVGEKSEDEVVVEGHMPGGLMDFDKGLMKVDFQLWPLFQAVELDHIITAAEVALSNSGRIIFCSKHPAMLNVAVSTLKYIVELRGWDGITMPMIHARDTTFVIEDPGPYIIGMPTECRYLLVPPPEAVIVDIDTNSLSCKSPPFGVITPRPKREKIKQKLLSALGHSYPMDRSIPMEFKVSYPKGNFRNFNRFTYKGERPHYLGERLKAPSWWRHEAIISVFDKILADKHKKPTLIQRLMKSGMARSQAQLSVGEQLAKAMMRRRALHYVETRDDLELKVAKINKRLLKLIQEGDHWKKQFEMFEKYADRLTIEANELKTKIERERREAKRLSNLANEQTKQNVELEEKLKNTEDARAEAMRQLSDMHQSIQELEREREEIMNCLEAQINGALAGLPSSLNPLGGAGSDTSSRPGTPNTNVNEASSIRSFSKGSTRSRPATANSMLSTQSKPMSVLGQVKGIGNDSKLNKRASVVTGATVETETERGLGFGLPTGSLSGNDLIAHRVASIQAKLELALNVVSSQRSSSVMTSSSVPTDSEVDFESGNETDTEGNITITGTRKYQFKDTEEEEEDAEIPDKDNNKTPTASRRPSNADLPIATTTTKDKEVVPPLPAPSNRKSGGSEEFLSADESFPNSAPAKDIKPRSPVVGRTKNTSSSAPAPTPIIMKPKSRTPAKNSPKKKVNGTRNFTPPSPAADDSDASDITAHPQTQKKVLNGKKGCNYDDEEEAFDKDGKRLSAMSSTTIAFGQAV
ncbi:hypothetical protein L486_03160 [Kwoniella mangroviensis CBS 10435]|uniref:cDENN domain-containing protein n=1 Tax=Kwoniella mangroviensis CBS 10435 TaxID=1331196 RepID=A0A1B9IT43_9TREE|nr:hypothetical protein L486_03160 [Kwoniella mangroviensis CBS 10435]